MFKALIAAATIGLVATQAGAACYPRDALIKGLKRDLGEDVRASGLTDAGDFILELFVSEENGTWRIAMTRPDGASCIVASGTLFKWVAVAPAGIEG